MQEINLPKEFLGRLKELYPDKFENIIPAFESRKPCSFRVNTIKTTSSDLKNSLNNQGFELEASAIPNAFILKNKSQRDLTETDDYKTGMLYIQGLSSMIPPLVLDPHEKETVLDACSAPGSKTTQMSALMENTGQIIANDMSRIRLYKLAANLKTLGATNVSTTHFRAQELWRKFPNTFDKALVDVPCSLEGRFLSTYPKSYSQWSVKKIKILSEHQKHILRSAISSVVSGGTIVYSTCTTAPEENEEVIDWILKKEPDITLEKISLKNIETTPGVTTWQGKSYDSNVEKCLRILPSENFEAFFIAKLIKK